MPLRTLAVDVTFGIDASGPVPPRPVGTLAEDGPRVYFEYDPSFIAAPLPVSPHVLPVGPGLREHPDRDFDYVPGLIADSVPDGWGRLVQDQAFAAQGVSPERVSVLDRLSALGAAGMGALTFRPASPLDAGRKDAAAWPLDLEALAAQAVRVYDGSAEELLPTMRLGGGSPGGARPKILAGLRARADGGVDLIAGVTPGIVTGRTPALPPDYEPYLVKFGAGTELRVFGRDAGAAEEAYARMARAAGLDLPTTCLLTARDGQRHFAIRRFDRYGPGGIGRLHMHTLGGLIHASHRRPVLDYGTLLAATGWLTRDDRAVLEAFRRAAFNVLAHNRDDHARNFAYLMAADGTWRFAPAYDLTFNEGINGQHTTTVVGEGAAPTTTHLRQLAEDHGLAPRAADEVLERVGDAVGQWPQLARELEIAPAVARGLADAHTRVRCAALPASTARRQRPPRR